MIKKEKKDGFIDDLLKVLVGGLAYNSQAIFPPVQLLSFAYLYYFGILFGVHHNGCHQPDSICGENSSSSYSYIPLLHIGQKKYQVF